MKPKKKSGPKAKPESNELHSFLTALVGKLPKVRVDPKPNHLCFWVGKKMLAFTRPEGGVALKLPESTVDTLVLKKKAARLVMGGKAMKEWAVFQHPKPADYRGDLGFFKESAEFVAGGK